MKDNEMVKKSVDRAYNLTLNDFLWKPYYPNNMIGNGLEGFYCIFRDVDNKPLRKFSIIFQYVQDEDFLLVQPKVIDRYILYVDKWNEDFEDYSDPIKEGDYEPPLTDKRAYGVNDFGSFVYACNSLEEAKKRVLAQCRMIYGYCQSFMIP